MTAPTEKEANGLEAFHGLIGVIVDKPDSNVVRELSMISRKGLLVFLTGRSGAQDGAARKDGVGSLNQKGETPITIVGTLKGAEGRMSIQNHILLAEMGTEQSRPCTASGSKMVGKMGVLGVGSTRDFESAEEQRFIGGYKNTAVQSSSLKSGIKGPNGMTSDGEEGGSIILEGLPIQMGLEKGAVVDDSTLT